MYRESWQYYHLLGMSCLYTGDYAGAYSYLRRASDLDLERTETLLGIGAVLLRRRQIDVAIATYLDVLDRDPRNARARRALQWLRTLDDPEDVVQWFESNRIRRVLPARGVYIPRPIRLLGILLLVSVGLYLAAPYAVRFVRGIIQQDDRPGSEVLSLEDTDNLTVDSPRGENGPTLYRFDNDEVESLFREIGRLFNSSQDNTVRREINRIVLSNAEERVKRQAELLRDYLQEPDFTTYSEMSEEISYQEVADEPLLYDGVYVRWRGRIANLVVGEEAITFDLLVGYESGRIVEGIVPVRITYAVLLQNGQGVELIGRVRALPGDGETPFTVHVTSIRTLNRAEGAER